MIRFYFYCLHRWWKDRHIRRSATEEQPYLSEEDIQG